MTLVAELPPAVRRGGVRRLAAALVVPTALGSALLSGASARADVVPPRGSLTVTVADGQVSWTVPAGVDTVSITAVGGSGAKGAFGYASDGAPGGHGALVREDVPVLPGQVLSLSPGGAATSSAPGMPGGSLGRGGAGGVGDPWGGDGGGGGAASAVSSSPGILAVAGGGGGGGGAGLDNNYIAGEGGSGGGSGSAATGASGGAGGSGHVTTDPRDVGQTGAAAAHGSFAGGGGGGGGGLDGGSQGGGLAGAPGVAQYQGGSGGGGAGGLSFAVDPAATFDIAPTTGDGWVTITWGPTIGTTTTLTALSSVAPGTPVTFTAEVAPAVTGGTPVGGTVAFERVDPVTGVRSFPVVVPVSNGVARWTFTPITLGSFGIEALYSGDGGYSRSRSGVTTVDVVRPAPGLSASTNRLLIGNVPTGGSATQTVTLTNTGNIDWSAADGLAIGDPAVSLDTSRCPSLRPGDSCAIPVTWAPSAVGPFVSTVTFSVGSASATLGVYGSGVAGVSSLTASPSPVAFGNVAVGSSATRKVSLTNTGNLAWSTSGASAEDGVVHLDASTCSGVAPGGSCTATVTFTPAQAGPVSETLTLLSATGAALIPVTGAGVVAKPVVTRISPAKGSHLGGTLVTITGRNFTGVTAIKIGGVLMKSVQCSSSTTCTAVTPRGTGTKPIRVTTPAGTSALVATDRFTYL